MVSVLGWWYLWLVVSLVGMVVSMVYCSKCGGLVICVVFCWVLACWCIWCRGIWCSEFLQIRCIGGGGIGRGALQQLLYITAGLQGWSQYKFVHYRVGHCTWLYTIHGCSLCMVVQYTTHGCTVLQTAPSHCKPATGSSSYILQARTVHAQGNMQHLVFHLVVHWHVPPYFATLWRATL